MVNSIADLDAAIKAADSVNQAIIAAVTKIDADVDALLAKISATPGVDVTTEVTAIQSQTAALQTSLSALQAEDAKANPPAPAA